MKFISFIIFYILNLVIADESMDEKKMPTKDEISSKFKSFVKHYNRSYVYDPVEYQYRMNVFVESLTRQNMLNKREKQLNGTAIYGINKFSDWTREEFIAHLSKFHKNSSLFVEDGLSPCCEISLLSSPLKSSWDWRKKHKVTSVKNQGNCGSCWAFSATGVVETQWAIAKDMSTPLELSVQELVSCSENAGCEGGTIIGTLDWLANSRFSSQQKYFLLPASEYPYEEKESRCTYSEIEPKTGAQIKCACTRDFKGNETQLANYVFLNGSVGVAVNVVMWHDYVGGIIQHHCSDTVINHAVIIEGYDSSGKIPYWIVRNSWGSDFGYQGYLRIKMNGNICGIAEHVSFVRV